MDVASGSIGILSVTPSVLSERNDSPFIYHTKSLQQDGYDHSRTTDLYVGTFM